MTAHTRRFITAIALGVGLVIVVAVQNEIAGSDFSPALVAAAQTPDWQSLGPKVGERVPEFSLPDQHGTVRSLRSTLGPKGAVLVFFRSADW